MLRYWTAGESHGKTLLALVDGFPAGVQIETDSIDVELRRRQGGYGRGGRQRIESDSVELLSGIWKGTTLGSPIAMAVVTTLYGLIAANFIFAPLGNAIARKSRREESDREEVLTWLEDSVRRADVARPRPAADTPSIEEVQTDAEAEPAAA